MDGAHKQHKGAIGGFIVQDNKNLLSRSLYIGANPNAEYSEARAILEPLLKSSQLNLYVVVIHIDTQQL